jgi:hypothetical protein
MSQSLTLVANERGDKMSDSLTLEECPIGLFLSEHNQLCLKTEYGNNEGRIDAYIVSSGEFFWGNAPQTIANQRKQLVRPVDVDTHILSRCPACKGEGYVVDDAACPNCGGDGWVR